MSSGLIRLVTVGGECFEAEPRSIDEYHERDGLLHKFYLTDLVSKRGKRLVSVFVNGTLAATCPNYGPHVEIVRLNAIRRAFDQGALSFEAPFDERYYRELSLSSQDFRTQQARTDTEIRQFIIHKAYWLAHRFPIYAQTDGIFHPIPFDEPADLNYLGTTAHDIWRIVRRLGNQGFLEKILEGHARPTESLLSRYESGDYSGLGLTANAAAAVAARETADRKFARLAIDEARKSVPEDGRVHPKVGVVVVKDGRVLASAHRGEIPECHAEYIALEKKLTDVSLSGATVYTTLEPCTARKHPKVPCAIRLTDRRVTRVVIGMLDPDKRIRGLGQMALRKARIATDFFQSDLMDEVEELNRDFMRDRESHEGHLGDAPLNIVPPTSTFAQARYEEWRKLDRVLRASTRAMGYAFLPLNVFRPGDPRNDPGTAIQRGHDALRSPLLIGDALKKSGIFEKWDALVRDAVSAHEPREPGQRGAPTEVGFDMKATEFLEELGRIAREDQSFQSGAEIPPQGSTGISLEVHERRMAMYRTARKFVRDVMENLCPDLKLILAFDADTDEALFLFDESIDEYLKTLFTKAMRLHTLELLRVRVSQGDDRPEDFSKLVKEETDLAEWFSNQPGEIRSRFAPFLRVA